MAIITSLRSNNEPVIDITPPPSSTFTPTITLQGSITDEDGDQVRYKVNDGEWTEFMDTPISINAVVNLTPGINTVMVVAEDSRGSVRSQLFNVNFINESPVLISDFEYKAVYRNLYFNAVIEDAENDPVKYRISFNGNVLTDWTEYLDTPLNIAKFIPESLIMNGYNTLVIDYIGYYGRVFGKVFDIVKKTVESVYVSNTEVFLYDDELKASNIYTTYIKIPKPKGNRGYVKNAVLTLKVLSNNGETGQIKIAPVITDWATESISPSNYPVIDTSKEITVDITNTEGIVNIDITALAEIIREFESNGGIAIYSNGYEAVFSATNISVNYEYIPTILMLPQQTKHNNVKLSWKPIILKKPAAFKKLSVKRSTNSSFTFSSTVFQTEDIDVTSCTDMNVTEGEYYYKIEIEMQQFAYNGNQLDFDLEDESKFIKSDPHKVQFISGVVKLRVSPIENITLDLEQSEYDPDSIDVADGIISLLGTLE